MTLNLPERICECGCKEFFKPVRRGQKFKTRQCRYRYYNALAQKPPPAEKFCPHCGKAI